MEDFSLQPNYRIWFYQTDKPLTKTAMDELGSELQPFISEWAAHGAQLQAGFEWLNPYMLAIGVNEKAVSPSGCSIDSCIRFLRELGAKYQIDFFVRMKSIALLDNEWKQIEFSEVKKYISNKIKIVDTTLTTWNDFLEKGIISPEKSGLAPLFNR